MARHQGRGVGVKTNRDTLSDNMPRNMKQINAIVAVARNWAIGTQGKLLCRLPADLRHFKELTMGHSIVMGRRTFESFPRGPLPGRENIVLTRDPAYSRDGIVVAHSLQQAFDLATNPVVWVIGGEQIYSAAMPLVQRIELTFIQETFLQADAFFPQLNPAEWRCLHREPHEPDEKNPYNYDFVTLIRKT